MARDVLTTSYGRGRELADLLIKELSLPVGVTAFEVRFEVGSLVTVKCEYCPEDLSGKQVDG